MRVKKIKGYSDYLIHSNGSIFSSKSNKVLKPHKNNMGYYVVDLCRRGKVKKFLLHRLLAEAFIPNPKNLPIVRHLNDLKRDNRLENLAWGTRSDNEADRKANGWTNPRRYFSKKQVISIFYDERPVKEIAEYYAVSTSTINNIKYKTRYKEITKDL